MKFLPLLPLLFSFFSLANSYNAFPMGSNSSTFQLQARQDDIIHCGDKVKLRRSDTPGGATRTCTLGFAVKKAKGKGSGQFDHGYLTLGDCVPVAPVKGRARGSGYNVMYGAQNLVIGKTRNSEPNLKYDPANGLDYAILKITEPQVLNFDSVGIATNDLNQPPVIKTLNPITPTKGAKVCFVGSYSGLVCGKFLSSDGDGGTRVNPWAKLPLQTDYFLRVAIVELSAVPYIPIVHRRSEDFGAPVFVPIYDCCNNPTQIVAAHPVGIFLDHSLSPFVVTEVDGININLRVILFSFYYQPLNLILENEPNLDLLISPQ